MLGDRENEKISRHFYDIVNISSIFLNICFEQHAQDRVSE